MRSRRMLCLALAISFAAGPAKGGETNTPDPLTVVASLDAVTNGVAIAPDGRMFLSLLRLDGSAGPQAAIWRDKAFDAYPDRLWNSWEPGRDATTAFVRVNAVRIGPDGSVWVVDAGTPGIGNPKVPHGPKVVKIDPKTNAIEHAYDLDGAADAKSSLDDIRFHGSLAYVTDAGAPGLIVLDLKTGTSRRILDGDPSMTAQRPVTTDAHVLRGPDGKPVKIHSAQIEVSPDGKFLFYQPASGPMSRIATRYIDDPKLTNPQLAKHVTTFAKTPPTGGTAIDAKGNIYCSDINRHRIVRYSPDGVEETLIEDPRLLWVDAMWLDKDGFLYLPAAQIDRMAPFNGGTSKVRFPVYVYKMKVDATPPSSDHP